MNDEWDDERTTPADVIGCVVLVVVLSLPIFGMLTVTVQIVRQLTE